MIHILITALCGSTVGLLLAVVPPEQDSGTYGPPNDCIRTGWGVHGRTAFGEPLCTDTLQDGVRLVMVGPPATGMRQRESIRLILYALPNGNTIEQTMGREVRDSVHWRFGIQHIAAQTRMLRATVTDQTIVIAYLEAPGLSWPAWRRRRDDSPAVIRAMVDTLRSRVLARAVRVTLTGHSGGGSFLFGFIEGGENIPAWVERISFLDSNYGFSPEAGHGEKILRWLEADSTRVLSCIAYDDREIMLEGKKVVGPGGGTYRKSVHMINVLGRSITLGVTTTDSRTVYRHAGGRVEFVIHRNPGNAILHTVLVERNGFLHAMTVGTRWESAAWQFWGDPAYKEWIER